MSKINYSEWASQFGIARSEASKRIGIPFYVVVDKFIGDKKPFVIEQQGLTARTDIEIIRIFIGRIGGTIEFQAIKGR